MILEETREKKILARNILQNVRYFQADSLSRPCRYNLTIKDSGIFAKFLRKFRIRTSPLIRFLWPMMNLPFPECLKSCANGQLAMRNLTVDFWVDGHLPAGFLPADFYPREYLITAHLSTDPLSLPI